MESVEQAPPEITGEGPVTTAQIAPAEGQPEVKPQNLIAKFEYRTLRYDFSAKEIHEIGISMTKKMKELASTTADKKSYAATAAAREKELNLEIGIAAEQYNQGFEDREVKCEVIYNQPENGLKSLIRGDNKQLIIEKMNQYDFNLFTQGKDAVEKNDSDIQESDLIGNEKDKLRGKKGRNFVKGPQSTDILNRMETGEDKPSKSTASNTRKGKGKRVAQSAEAPSGIIHDIELEEEPNDLPFDEPEDNLAELDV